MTVWTPKLGHKPITMQRMIAGEAEKWDFENHITARGQFVWRMVGDKRTLVVAIPRLLARHSEDEGTAWCYGAYTIDHPNSTGLQWSWDGHEDKPTLSPSIHAEGMWHGWVREGQLVEA